MQCHTAYHQYDLRQVDPMSSNDATGPRKLSGKEVMSEAKIPIELLTGPPVPESVEEGWFLEDGPLFITARIMSDREAERIHWAIFPGKDDPDYRSSYDYISTLIELMIENRGHDE